MAGQHSVQSVPYLRTEYFIMYSTPYSVSYSPIVCRVDAATDYRYRMVSPASPSSDLPKNKIMGTPGK